MKRSRRVCLRLPALLEIGKAHLTHETEGLYRAVDGGLFQHRSDGLC